jgi:DNA-binding transcriptional MocR family regulator
MQASVIVDFQFIYICSSRAGRAMIEHGLTTAILPLGGSLSGREQDTARAIMRTERHSIDRGRYLHRAGRRRRVAEAVVKYFPPGTRLSVPGGGITLWIELPQKLSSERVFDATLLEGILTTPGLMFSNSNRFDHFLRINYGLPNPVEFDQALRRVGEIVERQLWLGERTQS